MPDRTPCRRCNATGRYIAQGRHGNRDLGECFACKGFGYHQTPSAPIALDPQALAPILAAFAHATATLKRPRLNLGTYRITLAKPDSANPGALYVKRGDSYLGKITTAKFLQSRECTNDDALAVVRLARDPLAHALAHGRETGQCAICSRTLSDPASLEAGIGPICARNFGWALKPQAPANTPAPGVYPSPPQQPTSPSNRKGDCNLSLRPALIPLRLT